MKFKLPILFFIIASALSLNAEEQFQESLYDQLLTGEYQTKNYDGPLSPLIRASDEKGKLAYWDDVYLSNIFNNQIQDEFFDLKGFWFNKINDQSACPDSVLAEKLEYMRYLYRLTTISYLFETLKIQHRANVQLGGEEKNCSISFENLLGQCSPQSDDMKKFKERAYGKFANDFSKIKYDPLFKSELASWLTLFNRANKDSEDPLFSRLHLWCDRHDRKCSQLSLTEIKQALSGFCESDTRLLKDICDEKDEMYGLSQVGILAGIVKKSGAFNLINSGGMGENCLRRFEKIFSKKEKIHSDLYHMFQSVQAFLVKENSRYVQGELFLPGALKEFDNKGLSDFLTALKPPVVEVIAVAPKPIPVKVNKEVIKKPDPVQVPTVIASIPEPEIVPEIKISEFESAVKAMEEKNLDSYQLNMDAFQSDFEFTIKMISELTIPLRKFQTRKALNEMKRFDKLGSKEAPLGLVFLKFLIDTENHQGLYNVIGELGDKFWVMNDLEKLKKSVFVEIKNNSSTQNRWQINLIRPQKNSGAKN